MRPNARFWRPFLLIWAGIGLLMILWSFATPIGAAPDEPAHFVKAASVVRGQLIGMTSPDGSVVKVPRYVAFTQSETCFAFQNEITADCSPIDAADPAALVPAATTAGLYNPVYYLLVGWPSLLLHDQSGLYAMRIVSGLLTSFFVAVTGAQLLSLRRRTVPVLALGVAVTPMILFLGGAVNPNALEATGTLSVFVTMFLVVRHADPSRLPARVVILVLSATVAVTMRGLSPLWVAIALLSPLLLLTREVATTLIRSRWARTAVVVIGAVAVYAVVWIVATNSLSATYTANASQAPGIGDSPLQGFLFILFGTFGYAQGMVGVFGWLDTPAPLAVFFTWSVFAGGLVLVGVLALRARARILMIGLLVALIVLPAALQATYIRSGGIIWQGRYALPLFLCLLLALGLLLAETVPGLDARVRRILVVVVVASWAFCQVYSFGTALRRYSVGLTGDLAGMVTHPSWSPPGGIVPLTVTFAILCALASWLLVRTILRQPDDAAVDAEAALSPSRGI